MAKMQESKQVTINNVNFFIRPFSAMRSAGIGGELAKTLSPIALGITSVLFGNDLGEGTEKESLSELNIDDKIPNLLQCLQGINEDSLEHLLNTLLLKHQKIYFIDQEGQQKLLDEDELNELFCCDLVGMIKLAIEVVKVNYGSFFDLIGNPSGALRTIIPTKTREVL